MRSVLKVKINATLTIGVTGINEVRECTKRQTTVITFALVMLGSVLARIISRCPIPRANWSLCMTVRDKDIPCHEDPPAAGRANAPGGRGLRRGASMGGVSIAPGVRPTSRISTSVLAISR